MYAGGGGEGHWETGCVLGGTGAVKMHPGVSRHPNPSPQFAVLSNLFAPAMSSGTGVSAHTGPTVALRRLWTRG
jgi:hypothetical protein